MNKLDALLYEFLVENSGMPTGEFQLLTEDVKNEVILSIANEVLNSIQTKMNEIDTTFIDKTRGEIKNLMELKTIQDVINKLSNLAFSYSENISPNVAIYLKEITKALYNLNKYSAQFREAYRAKKTLLVLNYQAVILSIISSLSYLVSTVVDFKDVDHLKIKLNANVEEILPLKSIMEFNKSVENGALDSAIRDVSTLREFYIEYDIEQLGTIYEAMDIAPLISKGVNAFTTFFNNGMRNGIVMKVLGVIMIILSLRDIFYTLSNSRIKIGEKIQNLKTFLNVDKLPSPSALARFVTFNNKNSAESAYASEAAIKEIAIENKEIIQDVKSPKMDFDSSENDFIPTATQEAPKQASVDIFSDFNF